MGFTTLGGEGPEWGLALAQSLICYDCHRPPQCQTWPVVPDIVTTILTVEGMQVDGEAIGLSEALSTVPADIWLVPSVRPHVPGQLDGLGEHSITVLACIHFPCKCT